MKNNRKLALFLTTTLAVVGSAVAEENLWLYTKGTDTRPQGSWELKLSNISRLDKDSGDYAFHDIRPEIEYGVTDRLTLGAELMIFSHNYSDVEWGPMSDFGGPGSSFNKTQVGGFELTAKYNILSPYKDPIGLSLAASFEHRSAYRLSGHEIDQDSFVATALFQKNWLDNTLQFAFNAKVELERRKDGTVLEEEVALDLSAGISYRIAPKWFIGLETRYQSDYLNPQDSAEAGNAGFDEYGRELGVGRSSFDLSDIRLGDQYQYGTYLGPTVHYAEEGWWATFGILYQIKGGGDESRNDSIVNGKNYDEHEKWHVGATVGFEF